MELTKSQRLRAAWVEWISQLEDWEWYCHFTFREPVHPEQANKRYLRFTRDINRNLYGRYYGDHGLGVPWVRGLEWQEREVIHFHGLYGGGVSVLRRLTYMDMWNEENGFARILPYDKKKGALFYLVKYVLKGGEIDLYIPKKGIQKSLLS
jgi:hypothetical protein